MPSEAEVKCSNPKCGYFNVGQVCTKCGTLTPPQAEVVASRNTQDPSVGDFAATAAGEVMEYLAGVNSLPNGVVQGLTIQGIIFAYAMEHLSKFIPPEPPPAQGKEEAKQGEVEILREFVKAWDAQIVMAGVWMIDCDCQSRLIPKMQEAREVLRRKESPCSNESQGPGVYYFGPDGTGAGNGTAIDITPNPHAAL